MRPSPNFRSLLAILCFVLTIEAYADSASCDPVEIMAAFRLDNSIAEVIAKESFWNRRGLKKAFATLHDEMLKKTMGDLKLACQGRDLCDPQTLRSALQKSVSETIALYSQEIQKLQTAGKKNRVKNAIAVSLLATGMATAGSVSYFITAMVQRYFPGAVHAINPVIYYLTSLISGATGAYAVEWFYTSGRNANYAAIQRATDYLVGAQKGDETRRLLDQDIHKAALAGFGVASTLDGRVIEFRSHLNEFLAQSIPEMKAAHDYLRWSITAINKDPQAAQSKWVQHDFNAGIRHLAAVTVSLGKNYVELNPRDEMFVTSVYPKFSADMLHFADHKEKILAAVYLEVEKLHLLNHAEIPFKEALESKYKPFLDGVFHFQAQGDSAELQRILLSMVNAEDKISDAAFKPSYLPAQ